MVVILNKKHKKEYFKNLNAATNSEPFRDKCKPYFSNKHTKGDSNILLIEKDEILLRNKKIADALNSWSTQTDNKNADALQNLLKRFQPVSAHIEKENIGFPSNKATAGGIPIIILKKSGFTFENLTSRVSEAISYGIFPDSLKLSNIVSVHKKKYPTDKCN